MNKKRFWWWPLTTILLALLLGGSHRAQAQVPIFYWPTDLSPDGTTVPTGQDVTLRWNKGLYITDCNLSMGGVNNSSHDVSVDGLTANNYHVGALPADTYNWSLSCGNNQNGTFSLTDAEFVVGNLVPTPTPTPTKQPGCYDTIPVAGRAYYITNRKSGKLMDVSGSGGSGTAVIQYSNRGGINQQWTFTRGTNGYYVITPQHSTSLRLDVTSESTVNGTRIEVYTSNNGTNQDWSVLGVDSGYVQLQARHSSKLAEVKDASTADGAQVIQWENNGGTNQQWQLVLVNPPASANCPNPIPPTATPIPKLTISQLEITQAVQCLNNSDCFGKDHRDWCLTPDCNNAVPLLLNKPTWIRIYVKSEQTDGVGVTALLKGFDANGIDFSQSPIDFSPGGIIAHTNGGDRGKPGDTLNFQLPIEWTRHDHITLEARIYPPGSALSSDTKRIDLTFTERNALHVYSWRLRFPNVQVATAAEARAKTPFMAKTYPLNSDVIELRDQGEFSVEGMTWESLVSALEQTCKDIKIKFSDPRAKCYGWVPKGVYIASVTSPGSTFFGWTDLGVSTGYIYRPPLSDGRV